MARIRSIHPHTPTDPDFASLPIEARLLFIYSWMIADDAGNLEHSPRGLKMALFPGDDKITVGKIGKLVDLLITGRFFQPYEVDGKAYLHVRNFARYQKIDHPTKNRFPLFPGQSYAYHVRDGNSWISQQVESPCSPNTPRTLPESTPNVRAGRDRKGKEGKGKEGEEGAGGEGPDAAGRSGGLEAPPAAATQKDEDRGNGEDGGEAVPPDLKAWGEKIGGLAREKQERHQINPKKDPEEEAHTHPPRRGHGTPRSQRLKNDG